LQAIAGVVATAATPLGWAEVARAVDEAHATAQAGGNAKLSLLSAAEAADIEAVAGPVVRSRH
jgi:hypothetical protein